MNKPVTHAALKHPVFDSVWFFACLTISFLFVLSLGIAALLYLFL